MNFVVFFIFVNVLANGAYAGGGNSIIDGFNNAINSIISSVTNFVNQAQNTLKQAGNQLSQVLQSGNILNQCP